MTDQTIDSTYLTTQSEPTRSPFLPGTTIQIAWDSTSLGLIKTCARKYQYEIIDGWQSKDESIHLRFGIEFHKALEDYDRAVALGEKHEDAIRSSVQALHARVHDWIVDQDSRVGRYKNNRSILQLVIDYLDHFAHDPARTVILDNGKPAVELSFRFELDWGPETAATIRMLNLDDDDDLISMTGGNLVETKYTQPYLLCGHLDRVVDFNDQLYVMDRKTCTTTPSDYYFKQFEPNNQMTLYSLAGKVVLNSPIRGVIIDAAQVLIDKPNKFVRGFTLRTPAQIEEWLTDLRITLSIAESYATEGYFPMNDTACNNYGGCRFRDVCSKDPGVRHNFLKADFVQLPPESRWNPLLARG